ncbi:MULTISPECIES: hypothetical protein [unclassified Streptomyces]|uniref:hypothetical protein n=1 Tax=unclassified Streptomyces TaxID=2593676 RepID=UPI00131A2EB3|nr:MULTISPECIES: hypothetical protein [unclassified Streptomyces]MYT31737.1 hypothetical protein [Streptomyces sp. SID8354]
MRDGTHTSAKGEGESTRPGSHGGERGLSESGEADPSDKPDDHGNQGDNDNVVDAVVAG